MRLFFLAKNATHNKSLDASGGSVFLNLHGAADGALIRAAASTQTFGAISMFRILSLLCIVAAVAAAPIARPTADEISSDEYSVYSDLINSRFLDRGTKLAVIEARTHLETQASIPKEFENDLLRKMNESYPLQRRFHLRRKYVLITKDEVNRLIIDDPKGGDTFWKTYPKSTGLLILSRVGFDITRTKAFVCAADICGPLCGYGYSFVLEKQNGMWKIRNEKQLWIS